MSKLVSCLFFSLSLLPAGAWAAIPGDEPSRRKAVEHQRKGEQLLRSERFEAAVQEFRQAIALDPLFVIAHFNLGQAYMSLKQYPDAVTAYQACKEAVNRLGMIDEKEREQRDRQNEDEIRELRSNLNQLQSGIYANKSSQVDANVVRMEERIRILEASRMKGREVVVVPAEVNLGLGSAYFRQDKLEDAERCYRDAIQVNGKLGAAHNNLAVIYMLTGRFADAHNAVAAAESAGFTVPARFKADLEAREKASK